MKRSKGLVTKLTALLAVLVISLCFIPAGAEKAGDTDSFFAHTVFVGDSLTQQLKNYAREKKLMGSARFLCATNYRLNVAASKWMDMKNVQLKLGGSPVTVPEALQILKADRVFILLGLNDHAGSNLDYDIQRYSNLIDHIREKMPDIMIVAQSLTPIQKHLQGKTLNQANMDAFNTALEALCAEKDVCFLDIATPLKDENGFLNSAYARDRSDNVHLNDKGLKIWAETLSAFADSRMTLEMAVEEDPPAESD